MRLSSLFVCVHTASLGYPRKNKIWQTALREYPSNKYPPHVKQTLRMKQEGLCELQIYSVVTLQTLKSTGRLKKTFNTSRYTKYNHKITICWVRSVTCLTFNFNGVICDCCHFKDFYYLKFRGAKMISHLFRVWIAW